MSTVIVSACCSAPLKWIARLPNTAAVFSGSLLVKRRVLGKPVRAYCCTNCGKADR